MIDSWTKRIGRPLSSEETRSLIEKTIRERIFFQEAEALGLRDPGATAQQHIEQKLYFLAMDLAEEDKPTEGTLKSFYEQHQSKYIIPQKVAFSHVYINPGERGGNVLIDSEKLLQQLKAFEPVPLDHAGDVFPLQRHYPLMSQKDVALIYGNTFAQTLFSLADNEWHGPLHSTFGLHLVKVVDREEEKTPPWEEVRKNVFADWKTETQRQREEILFEQLRMKYQIIVEVPPLLEKNFDSQ